MPTEHLALRRCQDGYYRTSWTDETGQPHQRSFGRDKRRAQNRFARFRAEWLADPTVRNPTAAAPLTVRSAWERFEAHAKAYYRKPDGTLTGEARNFADAMRHVLELYGELRAVDFGPQALKAARRAMCADLCLHEVNKRVRKVRGVFRWLASEQLVPATVWHALQTVSALQAGRVEEGLERAPRVSDEVVPVPDPHIWAVVQHVPATVAALIQVQLYSGMRPGEACIMRPCDLRRSGSVWIYTPSSHKMERVQPRRILLGPKAQGVIESFLTRQTTAYMFSPLEALRQRFADRKTHRHQAVDPPLTGRRVADRYTTQSYGRSIADACRRHGIPHWSPGQLRHNAATLLREHYGLDVAAAVLGHASVDTTELYALLQLQKAQAAMEQVG